MLVAEVVNNHGSLQIWHALGAFSLLSYLMSSAEITEKLVCPLHFSKQVHEYQSSLYFFYHAFNFIFYFTCIRVLPACMYVYHFVLFPQRPEEDVRIFGAGVIDGCKLPCGCWELNPGHLQEQQVL